MKRALQFAQTSRLCTALFCVAVFILSLAQATAISLLTQYARVTDTAGLMIMATIVCLICISIAMLIVAIIRWAAPDSIPTFLGKLILGLLAALGVFLLKGIILGLLAMLLSPLSYSREIVHILSNMLSALPVAYGITIIGRLVATGTLRLRIDKHLFAPMLASTILFFLAQYGFALLPHSPLFDIAHSVVTAIVTFMLFAYVVSYQHPQRTSDGAKKRKDFSEWNKDLQK